jgi:ubiquinone/menaquinone biosynthesis C-methylase UbiE
MYILLIFFIITLFLLWWFAVQYPCPSWLFWMVEQDNPFTKVNRAKHIIEILGVEAGMHILDAGCGPGRLTLPLAKAVGPGGKIVALDFQEEMLERVRGKVDDTCLNNVEYLQIGLGEGRLSKEAYDRIVLVTVLGEVPDRSAVLQEMYHALKPEGILSVTEVIFDPHFQQRSKVSSLARQCGFSERVFFGWSLAYTMHFDKQ